MGPIWMTLLLVSTLGFFSWSVFRRLRQIKIGVPDPRFAWTGEQIADRRSRDVDRQVAKRRLARLQRLQQQFGLQTIAGTELGQVELAVPERRRQTVGVA